MHSTTIITGPPRLPLELEQEIFELAAHRYPEVTVSLTLVAHRVQIWIEKIIYKTISLSTQRKCTLFLRTLDSRPPEFFSSHVKAICLPYFLDTRQASRIVSLCSRVENLGCWAQRGWGGPPIFVSGAPDDSGITGCGNPSSAPGTGYMQLSIGPDHRSHSPPPSDAAGSNSTSGGPKPRRLSITLRDLFPLALSFPLPNPGTLNSIHPTTPHSHGENSRTPDFTHPLFKNITHLRINDPWTSWTSWCRNLSQIPHLTHLALDFSGMGLGLGTGVGADVRIERIKRVLLDDVVSACKGLKVCVLYVGRGEVKSVEEIFRAESEGDAELAWDDEEIEGVESNVVDGTQQKEEDPEQRARKELIRAKSKIVVMQYGNPLENWEADARGALCHWKIAEKVVDARREERRNR
ncbi:hypothetical protein BDN72DRAFT_842717 [Pluteus cervinus]|uniref:Uncharacterized protein n=1 Tax=Pluteus cervinus TaxID=181527 RepID=A0ACD3AP41_9AGAR|nr:hypothetical protein BDN72DRAFT_842717 [Pluteus cervinus]